MPLTFKLEFLQHAGSFKARGAFANLLLRKASAAGVVAASGGNHGVAVACAAHRLGVPATDVDDCAQQVFWVAARKLDGTRALPEVGLKACVLGVLLFDVACPMPKPAPRTATAAAPARRPLRSRWFVGPGVPPDRLAALRRAFDETMKDPDFLAEAERIRLGVSPLTGEEVQKLVAQVSGLSPALLEKVRAVYPAAGAN